MCRRLVLPDDEKDGGFAARSTVDEEASYVNSAAFSPDGRYVVTANQDGTARIADATGEELFALGGHDASSGPRVQPGREPGRDLERGRDRASLGCRLGGRDPRPPPAGEFDPVQSRRRVGRDGFVGRDGIDLGCHDGSRDGAGSSERNREFGVWPMGSAVSSPTAARWSRPRRTAPSPSGTPRAVSHGSDRYAPAARLEQDGGKWGAVAAEVVPGQPDRVSSSMRITPSTSGTSGAAGTDLSTLPRVLLGFAISPDGDTIVTVARDETRPGTPTGPRTPSRGRGVVEQTWPRASTSAPTVGGSSGAAWTASPGSWMSTTGRGSSPRTATNSSASRTGRSRRSRSAPMGSGCSRARPMGWSGSGPSRPPSSWRSCRSMPAPSATSIRPSTASRDGQRGRLGTDLQLRDLADCRSIRSWSWREPRQRSTTPIEPLDRRPSVRDRR